MSDLRRILVIRRDNIGDLVLTTPLIHALRLHFPATWIGALTNSYNAPVLDGNPDLDTVYAYDKAKHRPDRARLGVAAQTAKLLLELRRRKIDLAILAGPGYQRQAAALVRWIAAREVLGFAEPGRRSRLTTPVEYGTGAELHAAEDVFRLLAPLGIDGPPGPCRMVPDAAARAQVAAQLAPYQGWPVVAIHISARRPRQQWPADRYARVISELARQGGCIPMLLWAPGPADDPRHPGDDTKALEVRRMAGVPLLAVPTADLKTLAAAISLCDLMVCADGGAMHVAAALGKPVVAMFGDSPVHRWHPWGVPHAVVAAPGGDLANLGPAPVIEAASQLLRQKGGTLKVTITGANGFIGHAICEALVARGYATTAIVRRESAIPDLPPGAVPLVIASYADADLVHARLPAGDCMIHAAGRAHVLAGDQQASAYRMANVEGPRALARAAAARGYRRFVFLSSIGVLGAHDPGTPFTEESPPAPAWPYAATKLEAELALFDIGRATGLEVVVLRPPLVYGPGNRGNFPRLMRWVRSGIPIPLASIDNARSYVYVGNLADAAAACTTHPGAADRMFLVADGHDWSTPAMVRLIAQAMKRPARLWPVPVGALRALGRVTGKAREVGSLTDSLRIDSSLLHRLTGWSPPHDTADGVARTVRWFLDGGDERNP